MQGRDDEDEILLENGKYTIMQTNFEQLLMSIDQASVFIFAWYL